MGSVWSFIVSWFKETPSLNLFLIGLDGAGKSALTNKLRFHRDPLETTPTIGFEIHHFERDNVKLSITDFGGAKQFRQDWFFSLHHDIDCILFMVDVTDMERSKELKECFDEMLRVSHQSVSIIMILNKIDLIPKLQKGQYWTMESLQRLLMHNFQQNDRNIIWTTLSVKDGSNLQKLLEYLSGVANHDQKLDMRQERRLWSAEFDDPLVAEVRKYWMLANKYGTGLTFRDFQNFLKNVLRVKMDKHYAMQIFRKYSTEDNLMAYENFSDYFQTLMRHDVIHDYFQKYATEEFKLYPKDFQQFLKDKQHLNLPLEDCIAMMKTALKEKDLEEIEGGEHLFWSEHVFTSYLLDTERNNLLSPEIFEQNHDMTAPLTHYFINSSHNTYLCAHQLYGKSSVEMYRRAFRDGMRCVELDCWDGPNGEPLITHGNTLTSKISFEDVIIAINEYAFEENPYPIILSLEVHCTIPQQDRMASIMKDVFQDKLLMPFDDSHSAWPSPEELKYKVILKGKRIPQGSDSTTYEYESDEDEETSTTRTVADVSDEDENDSPDYDEDETKSPKEKIPVEEPTTSPKSASSADPVVVKQKKSKGHKVKVSQKMSEITALSSGKMKDIERSLKQDFWAMHSFAYHKADKWIRKTSASHFKNYNVHHFSRIYPNAKHLSSTNYWPVPYWMRGFQMVALNIQTSDRHYRLNQLLFKQNGSCGYLLKPDLYRKETDLPNVMTPEVASSPKNQPSVTPVASLSICIISAEQVPFPKRKAVIPSPYVVVTVVDQHNVSPKSQKRTHEVKNNGFNPCWNSELTFDIFDEESALVYIQVFDRNRRYRSSNSLRGAKSETLASTAFWLRDCKQGVRSVKLYGRKCNELTGCSLLVDVNLRREK